MKDRYRILKETTTSGKVSYIPQLRCLYFWWISGRKFQKKASAIDYIKDYEVLRLEHLKVDLNE